MKDITSTSFGLFIAFLLPGLEVSYTLSLWFSSVADVFRTFLTSQSNVGLFLLVLTAALTFGLIVAVFRWLIFELWLCRGHKLNNSDFAQLGIEAKLLAFRAAIDEHYRYHQFYGATAIVLPFFYAGLLRHYWISSHPTILILISAPLFVVIEYAIGLAAIGPYKTFMDRAKFILEKESHVLKGD